MKEHSNVNSVPAGMKSIFESIVDATGEFCETYLDDEYAQLSIELASALSRKRPSPLLRGNINTWACGIVYALGYVNFLFDESEGPYVSADQLCNAFGVKKSTAYQKSKNIRDMFRMSQFDPRWCLPSLVERNPLVWMIEVDGITVDARWLPREIQELAFEKGLIPYIPNETKDNQIDSIEVVDDVEFDKANEERSREKKKKKSKRRSEDSSQQLLDF
jgi:hypothetical protein